MTDNHMVDHELRAIRRTVGSRARYIVACGSVALLGVSSMLLARLMMGAADFRANLGDLAVDTRFQLLDRLCFLLLCIGILLGSVLAPIKFLTYMRRLLRLVDQNHETGGAKRP